MTDITETFQDGVTKNSIRPRSWGDALSIMQSVRLTEDELIRCKTLIACEDIRKMFPTISALLRYFIRTGLESLEMKVLKKKP